MLSDDYFVKVNLAGRKFVGTEFRDQTVLALLRDYDQPQHNVVDSSRMLLDVARLLGLVDRNADKAWKFTDLKHLSFQDSKDNSGSGALLNKAKQTIEAASKELFTDFDSFTRHWHRSTFVSVQDYLQAFYRYIPYVKLGIDDEANVRQLYSAASDGKPDPLQLDFARQNIVLRRVEDVFFKRIPGDDDISEFIRESLKEYALRVQDEAIPITNGCH